MERTLVTGAGGFIGSHLVEALCARGRRVRAMVHYNSRNSWGWLEGSSVLSQIEVVAGDVRDYDSVAAGMKDCREVFHLAALIGIPYSYESPLGYVRTNVEGTCHVLSAAHALGLERVVVTSTSEVYGTAESVPMRETHPLSAQSPYAASKIGGDQLALAFHRSFGLPVYVVRPFNVYGPRQSARAVIPTMLAQMVAGRRTLSLGNLSPRRDFTFVRDTVEGFLAIAESPELCGRVTHICSGKEISVGELAQLIGELCGVPIDIRREAERARPEGSEVERLCGDPGLIFAHTSWRPRVPLREGLAETLAWMKEHRELYKPDFYSK